MSSASQPDTQQPIDERPWFPWGGSTGSDVTVFELMESEETFKQVYLLHKELAQRQTPGMGTGLVTEHEMRTNVLRHKKLPAVDKNLKKVDRSSFLRECQTGDILLLSSGRTAEEVLQNVLTECVFA